MICKVVYCIEHTLYNGAFLSSADYPGFDQITWHVPGNGCEQKGKSSFCIAGNALLRRLVRIGVLDENKMKLDYVLGLRQEDFLERRLQTQVFKLGLAKSIHHARVLIRQRHIRSVCRLFSAGKKKAGMF